jgi:hypothetical protein
MQPYERASNLSIVTVTRALRQWRIARGLSRRANSKPGGAGPASPTDNATSAADGSTRRTDGPTSPTDGLTSPAYRPSSPAYGLTNAADEPTSLTAGRFMAFVGLAMALVGASVALVSLAIAVVGPSAALVDPAILIVGPSAGLVGPTILVVGPLAGLVGAAIVLVSPSAPLVSLAILFVAFAIPLVNRLIAPERALHRRLLLSPARIFFPEKRTPWSRSILRGQRGPARDTGWALWQAGAEAETERMVRSGGPAHPRSAGPTTGKTPTPMPILNNSKKVTRCTQRAAAVEQYVPKTGTIVVHAQPYTEQQIETVYQTCIDARHTLVNLRGQVAAALAAKNQADAAMKTLDVGLRDWVATTFGPKSQQAVDFGYAEKEPAQPTVEVKAAAQTKAVATRKARGTVGPKARLKITASTAPKS